MNLSGSENELMSELNKSSEKATFSLLFKRLRGFGGKGRIMPRRQDAGGGPEQSEG